MLALTGGHADGDSTAAAAALAELTAELAAERERAAALEEELDAVHTAFEAAVNAHQADAELSQALTLAARERAAAFATDL
jgi:Arc/MetJ family transcription regulator